MDNDIYDDEYRTKLLTWFLKDKDFLMKNYQFLSPEYFRKKWQEKIVVEKLLDYLRDYNKAPSIPVLVREIKDEIMFEKDKGKLKLLLQLIKDIKTTELSDGEYFERTLVKFARGEAVLGALSTAIPLFENQRYNEALRLIDKASRVGAVEEDVSNYFENMEDRVAYTKTEEEMFYPTLITGLDLAIGGVRRGQDFSGILAPTNVGKTTFLVNITAGMLFSYVPSLYISLEQGKEDIEHKFDALFSGQHISNIGRKRGEVLFRLRGIKKLLSPQLLIVKMTPKKFNVKDLRYMIEYTVPMKYGFKPGFVALDYASLMGTLTRRNSKTEEAGEVFTDIYGLTGELKIPIWTGDQSSKRAASKKIITVEDGSWAYEKYQTMDTVLALCQTKKEFINGIMRIFVAKGKFKKKFAIVKIKMDGGHVRILKSWKPVWYDTEDKKGEKSE